MGATRRTAVVTAGAAGLAAALSACGGSGGGEKSTHPESTASQQSTAPQQPTATGRAPKSQAPAQGALARTSDIPEGGGKVFASRKVVVTQPTKGEFKAFSAVCTHQGCLVGTVSGGTINCPCHGSKFDIKDGSVRHGPAARPLSQEKISVSGDSVTLG